MSIRLHDTLSGEEQPLRAPGSEPIKIYQCGPTVYASAHIGHARPAVVYDTLVRYLRHRGYDVVHVLNFTDVDDKIINRANEEGRNPIELAAQYSQEYLETMDRLGVERADYYPRVSEHIDDIIQVVQTLVDKGHAYALNGDVYFDVSSFEDYGKLSNRNPEELLAGARVEVDENKKNPGDFALWKAAKPGEISWESPWGAGRPGWHIECSALAMRYLGETLDIHGGGNDLVFPHHENEIAQSEAYSGKKPFSRVWMHCGLLQLGGEKMSKSEGNVISPREAIDTYGAEAVRFFLLSSHYRKPLNYDTERLENARKGWERFRNSIRNIENALSSAPPIDVRGFGEAPAVLADAQELSDKVDTVEERFDQAMDDDFNTALAIATLFELAGAANRYMAEAGTPGSVGEWSLLERAYEHLTELGGVLGIYGVSEDVGDGKLLDQLVDLLIEVRSRARSDRRWQLADFIRDELQGLDVVIEDTGQGTRWFWR